MNKITKEHILIALTLYLICSMLFEIYSLNKQVREQDRVIAEQTYKLAELHKVGG